MADLTMFAVLAQSDGGDAGSGSAVSSLVLFAILGAVFYFLLIRPQRRRVADMRNLQSSIGVGDEVRTVGGMLGRVERLDETEVTLDMGGGTRIRFTRQAIAAKIESEAP